MASQRVGRYIAVQQAKGLNPDPQQVARLIQQDMQFGGGAEDPLAPESPIRPDRVAAIEKSIAGDADISGGSNVTSFAPNIQYAGGTTSFAPEIGTTSADIGEVDLSDPTLGEALSGQLGKGTAKKGAVKGLSGAAYASLTTPSQFMSPATAAVKGFTSAVIAPVSLALALNSLIGSSVSAGMIGNSIEGAFGKQAAQEAANVMSGRVSLSSISRQGQNAYANAKIAAEQAPKSVLSHVWSAIKGTPPTPITSTVTPHHTPEAISEGFGVTASRGVGGNPNMVSTEEAFNQEFGLSPEGTTTGNFGGGEGGVGGAGIGGAGDSGIGPGNY